VGLPAYSCNGLRAGYRGSRLACPFLRIEDLGTFEKRFGGQVAPNPFSNHSQIGFWQTLKSDLATLFGSNLGTIWEQFADRETP